MDKETLVPVPFKFNKVQEKYYDILRSENPSMDGVREIVLKARQQGMSSFILALFAADFLLRDYSVSICISHRKDSTEILFKKVKGYLDSYFEVLAKKQGVPFASIQKQFMKTDSKNLIENAMNHAVFYIGTAGAKVGGRGGTARNILYSETAFYQDTELITAQEIVVGTAQQVPQGKGMIFLESTANGEGNYYQKTWEQAERGESVYKPRFFGWDQFYSQAWIDQKKKEFPNKQLFQQEYPLTPEEAFIASGTPYFNNFILQKWAKRDEKPLIAGKFEQDGTVTILDDKPPVRIYRDLEWGEQTVVFGDPAESQDYCAAVVCSKKKLDFPIVLNQIMESSQFGYEVYAMCRYIFTKTGMWPKLAIERNTGAATIYVLKLLNYPDMFRMVDFTAASNAEKGGLGWTTTGHITGGEIQGTRRKMLDDLSLAINQSEHGYITLYDQEQLRQLKSFVTVKGRAQARANKKDDLVMATAGAWQIQMLTPAISLDDFDDEEFRREKDKWRFR